MSFRSGMSWSRGANSLLRKAGRRRPGRSSGGSGDSYEDSDEDSFFAANSDDELDHLVGRTRTDSEELRELEDQILAEEAAEHAAGSDSFMDEEDLPIRRRVGDDGRSQPPRQNASNGRSGSRANYGGRKPVSNNNSDSDSDENHAVVNGSGGSRDASRLGHGSSREEPADSSTHGAGDGDDDLMMEDLDDMDLDFEDEPVASSKTIPSDPVDEETCVGLREVVFGRATGRGFPDVWLEQGFVFNSTADRPGQEFGLVQHKGGPCGPIAAVQAHVLQHLLPNTRPKESPLKTNVRNWASVKENVLGDVLVEALATILARAAGFYTSVGKYTSKPVAVVALSGAANRNIASSSRYECDGFTESLQLYRFTDVADLRAFIGGGRAYTQFTDPHGFGVALLTYSAILSRGLKRVKMDACQLGMSQPFIGEHCYAAQELVNLLVAGGAYSNVFDGVRELDDVDPQTGDKTKLYGIPRRGAVGCLTLYEHYGYVKCGNNFKIPEHPIWVICSESHYSCFFSTQNKCLKDPSEPFDLFFYDALARHEELPEMSVDPTAGLKFGVEDGAPLEKVLRTKWKGAKIEWETEAIL
eukprot:INCI20272.1.p1 GENE.INCI20272.1~~INCI20272.1.p1  ORF type:complete len:585 (-),score=95.94 INCI20272.1:81-1835(-)